MKVQRLAVAVPKLFPGLVLFDRQDPSQDAFENHLFYRGAPTGEKRGDARRPEHPARMVEVLEFRYDEDPRVSVRKDGGLEEPSRPIGDVG